MDTGKKLFRTGGLKPFAGQTNLVFLLKKKKKEEGYNLSESVNLLQSETHSSVNFQATNFSMNIDQNHHYL